MSRILAARKETIGGAFVSLTMRWQTAGFTPIRSRTVIPVAYMMGRYLRDGSSTRVRLNRVQHKQGGAQVTWSRDSKETSLWAASTSCAFHEEACRRRHRPTTQEGLVVVQEYRGSVDLLPASRAGSSKPTSVESAGFRNLRRDG